MADNALSPQVMMAASVHAQPGVYAVLLGSGVSTAAGIPTAWSIVKDLLRKVAAIGGVEDFDGIDEDAGAWWAEHGDGPLGYGTLLEALAPTPAARQGLLVGYFEATDEDRDEGNRLPTAAHKSISRLVREGYVRVVVTTNFDRLMEQALDAEGVTYQVIARSDAVAGMAPLAHAKATVIKLHGDYTDLGIRNTPAELGAYPPEWQTLMARIFDEYGLIVSGWSADWDTALVDVLQGVVNRRYPLYWDRRSSKGETALRLLALRAGSVVPADSADDMFTRLADNIETLEKLAEPPLTTAMRVARLKRYLPDPVRRIDLHDLVMEAVDPVVEWVRTAPANLTGTEPDMLDAPYARPRDVTMPLLELLTEGVRHDLAGDHDRLWAEALRRLMHAQSTPDGGYQEVAVQARHYPALLALLAMSLTAHANSRDDLLLRLARDVTWRPPFMGGAEYPAVQVLHINRVVSEGSVNGMARWGGRRFIYAPSHLLRADLRDVMRSVEDDDRYSTVFDDVEYRFGLMQHLTQDGNAYGPNGGEFLLSHRWTHGGGPRAEERFRVAAERHGDGWPWWPVVGGHEKLDEVLSAYRDVLSRYRQH